MKIKIFMIFLILGQVFRWILMHSFFNFRLLEQDLSEIYSTPSKKKENLVDFLQNFHLRKSRFFESFSLRKTIGNWFRFVLFHMSSSDKNKSSSENRRTPCILISACGDRTRWLRGGFRKRADSVPSLLVVRVCGRPTWLSLDMRAAGDFAPSHFSLIFESVR